MIYLDEKQAAIFLESNGIAGYKINKIAGDASFRSYYRIFAAGKTFILMFCPPAHEDMKKFIEADEFLISNGFSAPKIFAVNEKFGFLLLEDLGDNTYSRFLITEPLKEDELYQKSCDCLLALNNLKDLEGFQNYNHALLFGEVMLFIDWYLPSRARAVSIEEKAQFKFLWFQLFDKLSYLDSSKNEAPVLVLRDYHADNLIILPDKKNYNQVGLLDFQDMVTGSRAYDLVSLLEDARRDVDEKNRLKLFDYYLQKANCDEDSFKTDYEILSLQRNLKILGIFARLSMRDGNDNYLKFLPRVLNFIRLRLELQNPIFLEISRLLKKFLHFVPAEILIDSANYSAAIKRFAENENLEIPSPFPKNVSAEIIANLQLISEVFQKIERETAEIAELIFDYLINATDFQIMTGTIASHNDKRINNYIKILNRLFLLSHKTTGNGGIKIINRKIVAELDRKTFTICMCYDGGISLDVLCDIVNVEKRSRTPEAKPVKVTIKKAFDKTQNNHRSW
jgi:aminoglycoside/choline kinase family phosphotransferase